MSLTLRQKQCIELLAMGTHTNREIWTQLGISERTFYTWKKQKEFSDAVLDRSRELLKESLPNIYEVLGRLSAAGSHQHIKIVLDHMEKLENMANQAVEGSITFTWTLPEGTPEPDAD